MVKPALCSVDPLASIKEDDHVFAMWKLYMTDSFMNDASDQNISGIYFHA